MKLQEAEKGNGRNVIYTPFTGCDESFDMIREGKHLKEIAEETGREYYLLSRKIREFKKNGKYKIYIRPQKYSRMTENTEIEELLNIINK